MTGLVTQKASTKSVERHENKPFNDDTQVKLVFFTNEFPSDDLKDLFRRLLRQSRDRRFRLLAAFLEESTAVLQHEVSKLPRQLKDLVPHFDTILTLVEHGDFRHGALGAAIESALLTVLELGMLIGHYEAENIEWDLHPSQTMLAGLSIGLLAGAAVALSSSLDDVVSNGAESVRVSFRLGVYVDDVSRKLEAPQPDASLQSWAHVVTGLTQEVIQDEVTRFNAETVSPDLTQVFISAADQSSVSVSGPPSRVKAAFQHSHILRYSKSLALPVYDGLCHASHLYCRDDIEAVINSSESVIPSERRVRLSLLSSQTGKPFVASSANELFTEIGTELLTGTIYLDNVTNGILDRIGATSGPMQCQVNSFRTTLVFEGILKALQVGLPTLEVSQGDMVAWSHKDFGARRPRSYADSKLAIVGMACRMPGGANDLELFWELLEQGRNTCTTVPLDRFNLETHFDPTGKTENATQTPYGNFIDRPGFFDAGFFNMSPKEAEQTDPMHRLAMVTAYEAMEMAGFVPDRTASSRKERIGTFYGQASDDYRELNASQNIGTYSVPGGERAFANGRINYFFKFAGPSFNVDTACSSGLAAVHAACSALWAGQADTVIAGGLNVITDPDNYAGLGNAHFLSKTGECKVWDKDADGYCRADGVGSVVIKRLEDAEAENDNILAVILSSATNHSAEAVSITHPHIGAQKDNYRQVLYKAGVSPLDVGYVELHGTGTQAGDVVESTSVADIFGPPMPRRRHDNRLHLSAVKSNIGHGEAAAGVASLIKALLVFQKNLIPRHIGIKTEINPSIPKDLERRNIGLAMVDTPWLRPQGEKRLALVNSFGAHGGNTTLLLEDGPEKKKRATGVDDEAARSTHIITLSAKSKKSLQSNVENLLQYLDQHPDTQLGDLSYTLCARRMHHNLRIATTASSIEGVQNFLRSSLETGKIADVRPIRPDTPSVVFAFTGQGSYYVGMGRELFAEFPLFSAQVLQLDRLVQRLGFSSVVPVIDGSISDGPISTVLMQISVVVLEIALAHFWSLLGIRPSVVVGHSLGEYAALVVAGVLSTADALWLVGQRAKLTEEYCTLGTHSMLSVRAPIADIERILGDDAKTAELEYEISCRNTHQDVVIGAVRENIDALRLKFEASSHKCVQMDLPYAFHTAQMDPLLDALEQMASHVPFKAPSIPVLSPLFGAAVFDGKTINAKYLRRAARETVDFVAAVEAAQDNNMIDDNTLWIDIGSHPICAGLVRSLMPQARVSLSCRRNEDNMATVAKSLTTLYLAGIACGWDEYFRPNELTYSLLNLPKYSWNEINYWIPYTGTWTLDKALVKYGKETNRSKSMQSILSGPSPLRTSLIHQVTQETVEASSATLTALSDIQHPDFLEAVHGHRMNNCGVATSSIWTDMALTVGEYLYHKFAPRTTAVHMNFGDIEVLHAQVANKSVGKTQLLALKAHLDVATCSMSLAWFNVNDETGEPVTDSFASGTVRFEDACTWRTEWDRITHLVLGRIEALEDMAIQGKASRLSKGMAYTLFKNVVDYADRYRGMESVILHEYEAVADIKLVAERHGTWHTPPHWIDSVSHLAGLIMNGSEASNTHDFFYVTPGADSFRLLKPLEPGASYRSYVRMFPLPAEAGNMHAGDIYILQDNVVVGMVGQIRFRRVPRVLMSRFFSVSGTETEKTHEVRTAQGSRTLPDSAQPLYSAAPAVNAIAPLTKIKEHSNVIQQARKEDPFGRNAVGFRQLPTPPGEMENLVSATPPVAHGITPGGAGTKTEVSESEPAEILTPAESDDTNKFLQLIARETGLNMGDLTPDATFVRLGVDSLMSLVLAEKFRDELGVEVKSSVFLECPTIGDITAWLDQYC